MSCASARRNQAGLAAQPPHRRTITAPRYLTAIWVSLALTLSYDATANEAVKQSASPALATYDLGFDTPTEPALQASVEALDARLRAKFGMAANQTSVGVLDLKTLRLALVRPDRIDYAASVPKIGILLAWFQLHPETATKLDPAMRHEFGLMIKASDNATAAKYSERLGLHTIQGILNRQGLYDLEHGGGLWIGKHYGKSTERYGDPLTNDSHAATIRQLLRYYLWLEQDKLVSPAASATMRAIFASPDIAHIDDKFVKGLAGREAQLLRKSGGWEDWYLDSAIVSGGGRHYLIAAMTHHPQGNAYLAEFAAAVDDLLK